MTRLLGGRGASAVMGFCMLAIGSSAVAQTAPTYDIKAAVQASQPTDVLSFRTVGGATTAASASKLSALYSTPAARTVTVALPTAATSGAAQSVAQEAAWLYRAGWPLRALVDRYAASSGQALTSEENCLATAVYFEARGETVEGQLAVARVVMNRAASGRYPASWCSVVKQPWQFSFVRAGQFPRIDEGGAAWRKAQAITRLAVAEVVPTLSKDVLWYHADYVAPSWGRRLSFVQKIGTHIFYRA